MSLIKRGNGGGLPTLRTMFSDLWDVDNFFDTPFLRTENLPAVNVEETEDSFTLELAAPGMEKKDFDISIENGCLNISSEKKEEKEEKDKNYTRKEFSYSAFRRSFTLPDTVDQDDIQAKYDNGILKVIVAKKEEAKKAASKSIDVS